MTKVFKMVAGSGLAAVLGLMLVAVAGGRNVLFGTENPGSGSAPNPETGKSFDDIKPVIDSVSAFTEEDRRNIFEENARRLFSRMKIPRAN